MSAWLHNIVSSGQRGACFSADKRYRYALWRTPEPVVVTGWMLFIGMNPSDADAVDDDATVRLWNGIAPRNGYGRYLVGNIGALIETDSRKWSVSPDPHGGPNEDYLVALVQIAEKVVCCWGEPGHKKGGPLVEKAIRDCGKVPYALGVTGSGAPRHPRGIRRDVVVRPLDELRAKARAA